LFGRIRGAFDPNHRVARTATRHLHGSGLQRPPDIVRIVVSQQT
jgi:hypothetical protein